MNKKYNIPFSIGILFGLILNAQVGIKTINPQGVFNIDTENNNATTGTPSLVQMNDDVTIDVHTTNGVNMTIGGKVATNSSAQLTLMANNKAILFNRVALTSVKDITSIPNPPTGTLVYNTATAGDFPDNVIPAYYYFNGVVWYKWQYGTIASELSQHDLLSHCTSTDVPSLNNPTSPMLAAYADFGEIKIKEKGTYIFSLRLYGPQPPRASDGQLPPTFTRLRNYLFMMKNGSSLVEAIDINIPTFGGAAATTHTATLQASLEQDDIITFRIGHYTGWYPWTLYANPILRANKTSLIYWKI